MEIERLKASLGKAKETLERHSDATLNMRRLSESGLRIQGLEERLKSQAEVIESLEEELKLSKVVQTDLGIKTAEAQSELDKRQQSLDSAAADSHADRESARLMIDALEQEVAELRGRLSARRDGTEHSADASPEASGELSAKFEQFEAKVRELTDEAESWKRKYEFLRTDAPAAYQAQSAVEK